jgi:hypothetical protein
MAGRLLSPSERANHSILCFVCGKFKGSVKLTLQIAVTTRHYPDKSIAKASALMLCSVVHVILAFAEIPLLNTKE